MSCIFFVVLAGVVAVVIFAIIRARNVDEQWSSAATELGLHNAAGGLGSVRGMSGVVDGYRVKVDSVRRGAGNSRVFYTRYRIRYSSLGLGLKLRRQGMFGRMATILGSQDIEVGDREFDPYVIVQAKNQVGLHAFLTPSRRFKIRKTMSAYPGLVIHDDGLVYERRGLETRHADLAATVRAFVRLADALTKPEDPESPLVRAAEAQEHGNLDEVLEQAKAAKSAEGAGDTPFDPYIREVAGNVLVTLGRIEEASELYREVAEERPDDVEVQELLEATARVEEEHAVPEEAPDPEPPEAEAELLGDASPVASALFATRRMSTEVVRQFEDEYQGRRVRWQGKLERASSYYSDMVFGSEKGTKATFLVAEIQESSYGKREVRAIVQLPPAAEKELRERRGEELTFEGELVRCDAFVRNLFVAHGRVL